MENGHGGQLGGVFRPAHRLVEVSEHAWCAWYQHRLTVMALTVIVLAPGVNRATGDWQKALISKLFKRALPFHAMYKE